MTAQIWGVVVAVLAIIGAAFGLHRTGARSKDFQNRAKNAEGALNSIRKREALDDEINQDSDLVARARRNGLVRNRDQ